MSVTPINTARIPDASAMVVGPVAPTNQQVDFQMGLPALDSLPGAPATLYLDFDGNFLNTWSTGGQTFTNVTTPVWDMDGNTSNFSAAEQAVIKEVWARVAEAYAPFDLDVTTVDTDPVNHVYADHQVARVVIGGTWRRSGAASIRRLAADGKLTG